VDDVTRADVDLGRGAGRQTTQTCAKAYSQQLQVAWSGSDWSVLGQSFNSETSLAFHRPSTA